MLHFFFFLSYNSLKNKYYPNKACTVKKLIYPIIEELYM